jgi:hypothetical protein
VYQKGGRLERGRLHWHDPLSFYRVYYNFLGHWTIYIAVIIMSCTIIASISIHYIPSACLPIHISRHYWRSDSHLLVNNRQRSLRFYLTEIHPSNPPTTPNPLHMSLRNRQNPLRGRIRSGGRTSRSFSIGVRVVSRELR